MHRFHGVAQLDDVAPEHSFWERRRLAGSVVRAMRLSCGLGMSLRRQMRFVKSCGQGMEVENKYKGWPHNLKSAADILTNAVDMTHRNR